MKIFIPPFYSRKINFLLLGGLILFLSCQSDPIVLNPSGGYEYIRQTFQLDNENSYSIRGSSHTGYSPRLYAGILSNKDTVYTVSALIKLLPGILDSHQVCTADSIIDVKIELMSTAPLATVQDDTTFIDTLIQMNALNTYLISPYDIDEDDSITHVMLGDIFASFMNPLSVSLKNDNSIEIDLFNHDSTIITRWCEDPEEFDIIVSYLPTDSTYLEFYSSDVNDVALGPKLSLEYAVKEEVPNSYNRYLLDNVNWASGIFNANVNSPHYIEIALSDNWDVINIYAFNLKENSPIPSNEMQSYDSLLFQDDIITDENINSEIYLLKIDVVLNSDDIEEEIDSIMFSLNSAIAFKSDDDPAGDNQTDSNPDSTEANGSYDPGELFNDYGIDNCPDSLETGNVDTLCVSMSINSAYRPDGTEGNNILNWDDNDGDGLWTDGVDSGEEWWDIGIDGCEDLYEFGNDSCYTTENPNWSSGLDLNGDNYNIDPSGDDWSVDNPNGTERNEIWNEGEPYQDWGSDGLPALMMNGVPDANNSEGNGNYEIGEPFFDTGEDGLFNSEESGYNEDGTENNNQFDGDGEFNDCGADNICNPDDGDTNDDYSIDPNSDNWSISDTTGTQGNSKLDWTDANDENGVWDDGEGEEWFDWGLDGIHDTLEAFQVSSVILPNLYDNYYVFDIVGGVLQEAPELVDSTVSLWISKIEAIGNNNNELAIDISIHSNVALKGLQFQLSHMPYTKIETVLQMHEPSIAQIGTEKLFEDLSLLPKQTYSEEELDGKLLIDYANDVAAFLDFDSLNLFLENEEYIFSHQYSNLVLYVDSTNTDIHEDGMWVYLTHSSDSGEEETLSNPIEVTSSADSVEISMSHILRAYQSGSLGYYNGFKLKADDILYNYSKLSIKNNPRIDVMYSQ